MRKLFILVILFSLLVISGCGSDNEVNEPLKIGLLPIEDSLPLYVAEAEKLFAKHDLQAELITFSSARERDMALQAGEIDGEVADILAAAFLEKSDVDVSIVSLTLGVTPDVGRFALLTSPNSGINSLQDAQSLSVAISENTIIEYVLDQLLADAGASSLPLEKVSIPRIPERLQMLLNDKIDAALLPDPLATLAEAQGAHVILDDTTIDPNLSQVVLLFRADRTADSERITQLLTVFDEAVTLFNKQPDQYRELFVEKARVPEPIKERYQAPHFSQAQVPEAADVDRVLTWMKAKQLIPADITYQELVDDSFLQ